MTIGSASDAKWVYDSRVHSDVEAKLRSLLVELGNADKILGIQVCITIINSFLYVCIKKNLFLVILLFYKKARYCIC